MDKIDKKSVTALQLAWNLGYMIVVPILVFGVGGVFLDKKLDSFPLFVFIGFILAMTISLGVVYVKTKDIIVMGVLPKKKNGVQDETKAHKNN